jgi:hypothetical protein
MPGNSVHVMVALLVFVACLYFSGWWSALVYLPIVGLYALLPDLDSGISSAAKIVRQFTLFAFLLGGLAYYFFQNFAVGCFAGFALIVLIAQSVSHHRGWVHTLVAGLFLSLPLLYLGWGYFLSGLYGYASHLALDGCLRLTHKPSYPV